MCLQHLLLTCLASTGTMTGRGAAIGLLSATTGWGSAIGFSAATGLGSTNGLLSAATGLGSATGLLSAGGGLTSATTGLSSATFLVATKLKIMQHKYRHIFQALTSSTSNMVTEKKENIKFLYAEFITKMYSVLMNGI